MYYINYIYCIIIYDSFNFVMYYCRVSIHGDSSTGMPLLDDLLVVMGKCS